MLPTLLGITILSFLVMYLAPGDPTSMLIDPKIKPEDLIRIKANLGLDKPVFIQYFIWLKNLFQGNLGFSYINGRPVLEIILERIPNTLILMGTALLITFIITIPLGIITALKKNSSFDHFTTIFTFTGLSLPTFWVGLVLMLIFSWKLKLLPSSGMYNLAVSPLTFYDKLIDLKRHLILPLCTLLIGSLAGLTRYQRGSVLNILNQDYIRTAQAKGLPQNKIIFKHILKNSLLPAITILGLSLPDLFGGAFITETIFAWPGMGRLGVEAIFARDYPVIMGVVTISAVLVLAGNFIADVLYAIVDPRIRYG
jgi:peptide/nickel transport system permease protein